MKYILLFLCSVHFLWGQYINNDSVVGFALTEVTNNEVFEPDNVK